MSETTPLERKLRWSRVLNLVLGAALAVTLIAMFAPGSAPLAATPSEGGPAAVAPETPGAAPAEPDATGSHDAESEGGLPPRTDPAEQPEPLAVSTDPTMTVGAEDAPITLMEWTDFTCPYCALFHRETLPAIVEQYVDEGLVRLEIHDVTFIGDQAEDAALAARAAGQQGRYLDYVYGVYALSADGARPDLSAETLAGVAEEIGLDLDVFVADTARTDLRSMVQLSSLQARQLGITSVPFFVAAPGGVIDGTHQVLQGAQPFENFEIVLDAALEQLGHEAP